MKQFLKCICGFLKGVLSETDGTPSSKRWVMSLLTGLFILIVCVNLFTGKVILESLQDQLFTLNLYMFSLVFGEKIIPIFSKGTLVK
jgi:hypothetical protein